MERTFRPFQTGSDADLAFAVMVLASYFTTFSLLKESAVYELLLLIGIGVLYIVMGIYGYAYAVRSGKVVYQISYFVIQLLLGGGIVHLGKGVGFNAMALLPLAGHSVVLLPGKLRLPVNLAIVLTYIIALSLVSGDLGAVWSGLPVFLAGQIFIVVFTQMAVNEEKARGEIEHLVKDLEEANQSLREYALQAEELAITKERNRLAREIHDGLGHYLTTVFMQIQAARAVLKTDTNKAMEAMGTAQNLTQEALLDVRRSVASLRDLPGDSFSLPDEITKMLKSTEPAGLTTEMKVIGALRPISPQARMTIFRAAQEGINNTVKHANADHLAITLDYTNASLVRMMVQDDGCGTDHFDGGFGLMGIRERVRMLNGDFLIQTAPGDGFRFDVLIPE